MPVSASSADHTASSTIADAGVPKRSLTCARREKNTPSRAIEKYSRGAVSISPFVALKIDTSTRTLSSLPDERAENRRGRVGRDVVALRRGRRAERGDVPEFASR